MVEIKLSTKPVNIPNNHLFGHVYYLDENGYLVRQPTMKTGMNAAPEVVGTERMHRINGALYFIKNDGYIYGAAMRKGTLYSQLKVEERLREEALRLLRQSKVREELQAMASSPKDITARKLQSLARKLE